jgi:polysaccharide export outer membrane protein
MDMTRINAIHGWAALLLIGVILFGCEHRISQGEFLSRYPSAGLDLPQTKSAEVSPELQATIDRSLATYTLGPDDVLAVVVTVSAETAGPLPVQARVDSEGNVELPMVGAVNVGGLTLGQAEKTIQKTYVPDFHRQATVHIELVEPALTKVLVVGAVVAPGLVELRHNECNLLYSTVRAGGMTQASSGMVTLQRLRGGTAETFDLSDPDGLRKALEIEPLQQGDMVTVAAAKPNAIFVGGLVNLVSPQAYPSGTQITVLQALAAAGGLRTDIIPTEATLVRRIDGEDVFVKLDLQRIETGKDENLQLAGGDILWVPHTAWTRLHEVFNNTVYIRAGATYNAGYSDLGAKYHGDLKNRDSTSLIIP